MALIPAPPAHQPHVPKTDVDPALLETPCGTMIEGPYEWHEYCDHCAPIILLREPGRKHRAISLYEILTAYRPYKCGCGRMLWDPNAKEDIP